MEIVTKKIATEEISAKVFDLKNPKPVDATIEKGDELLLSGSAKPGYIHVFVGDDKESFYTILKEDWDSKCKTETELIEEEKSSEEVES